MKLLVDTHILLWATGATGRLSARLQQIITDRTNDVYFSAASIWEIAIKAGLRRADFVVEPSDVVRQALSIGFTEAIVDARVACTVAGLPHHHRDPFDRILVAQAIDLPMRLYTVDATLRRYSELVEVMS